jgi:hypothetical protein
MVVDVRRDDEEPLRQLAWEEHRSIREHAGYLLHLAIQTALADKRELPTPQEVA